jgi:4-amino-4-deoxy-L-arabinose transferase-like glycosyltransferase
MTFFTVYVVLLLPVVVLSSCLAVSDCVVCGCVGCVSVLLLLRIEACRDNDLKKWVFIAWILFLYKCTFLLMFLHVKVF